MNFDLKSKQAKYILSGAIAATAGAAVAMLTSLVHDRAVDSDFYAQVMGDTKPRLLTVKTDGVTRQAVLSRGVVMPNVTLNFNQFTTKSLIAAADPQSACWYAHLKVTEGQSHLPFREKLFGGTVYSRIFANSAYDKRLTYSCVAVNDHGIVTPESHQTLSLR